MVEDGQEHRIRTRIHGHYKGVITWGTNRTPMTTKDLSLKGLSADTPAPPQAGEICTVSIELAPSIRLVIEGKIVRAGEHDTAVDFTGMDEESYAHLRTMEKRGENIEDYQTIWYYY